MHYFDVLAAKRCYDQGENVTEFLRRKSGSDVNTPEIIELAYDLQAGTYVRYAIEDPEFSHRFAGELASFISSYMEDGDSILDVGTGELTNFSLVLKHLAVEFGQAFAFDISWSRIYKGLSYAEENLGSEFSNLTPFVADMNAIPLADNSIDIIMSNHALEPNGGNLEQVLSELFRVARKKMVLFEPSYELNSEQGKARMDRLGYIKELGPTAEKMGAKVDDIIKVKNAATPLNPTTCYIITPPEPEAESLPKPEGLTRKFAVPGTSFHLEKDDHFYISHDTGLCFPVLKGIPVLKPDAAILATALSGN